MKAEGRKQEAEVGQVLFLPSALCLLPFVVPE